MRFVHALTLLAVPIVFSGRLVAPSTAPTPLERSLNAVHAEMRGAAQKLDADALFTFVVDTRGPIIEDGRLFETREAALASTRRGFAGVTAISYAYAHTYVTELSPTCALWVGDGISSATLTDGREVSSPFAETVVFTKVEGKWKVLHGHRSTPNVR